MQLKKQPKGDDMLEILQTKNINNYKNIIDELNLDINLVHVVEATDKDIVNGIGIYHFYENQVVIDFIDAESDLYLYDGMVRAILFLAMLKGIDSSIFQEDCIDTCIKLGFIKSGQNELKSISKFLHKCKSCEK